MDVNSAFLNGFVKEEVYVEQPPCFEDSKHPYHVYKLNKALHCPKQTSKAWYERLRFFLTKNGFTRGHIDTTFFRKDYTCVNICK